MDVSQPNNWPRVEELFRRKIWRLGDLGYAAERLFSGISCLAPFAVSRRHRALATA
jgi:hypothetical protein